MIISTNTRYINVSRGALSITNIYIRGVKKGRCMKTDHSDLKKIIHEHYATLCAVAVRFVKSPDVAEDIVQEAIIKYWEHREEKEILSIGRYLFTLVKHASLNYLRGEQRAAKRHDKYAKEKEEEEPQVLNQLIEEEHNQMLREAIKQLPDMQARIIRAGYSGLTNQEIAKLFQITIPTLKSLRYDALRKLREYFDTHL
jgi:RNA polymerase sigma-70 factor (ECF subfamily)